MKYEIRTSSAGGSGYWAKVFTIPRPSNVYINTFNMIFEIYYISAWSEPIIQKYGLSLQSSAVKLTKFPQLGNSENSMSNVVGYVVNAKDIDIYVKSATADASVYMNVLGVSDTDLSIKHEYASFSDTTPANIVYESEKSSIVDTFKEVKRTLSSTVYHSSSSVDLVLPSSGKSYFGIVNDGSNRMCYVNVGTDGSVAKNDIVGSIGVAYNSSTRTLTLSNLATNRSMHYILNYSE